MSNTYKYNPEDFKGIPLLPDDLISFYAARDKYLETKVRSDWVIRHMCWEDLIFSIKARAVEGFISQVLAQEMKYYIEELEYD